MVVQHLFVLKHKKSREAKERETQGRESSSPWKENMHKTHVWIEGGVGWRASKQELNSHKGVQQYLE